MEIAIPTMVSGRTGDQTCSPCFMNLNHKHTHTHTDYDPFIIHIPAYGKYRSSIKLSVYYDLIELNVHQISVQSRGRGEKKNRFSASKVHLNLVMVKI